ncbi:MAG: alpha/beta hydrolase [Solirubrobacteraceae bacterium]
MSEAGADTDNYGSPPNARWASIDWRRHQRWVQAGGEQLNVVVHGPEDGPVVLLLHGHDGSWRNWLESIPALASKHRVVAPDLPGFGASPAQVDVSIEHYVEVLAALCDELAVERAALVGSSMGGLLACELALARPALADRLVLVAAAGLSDRYMRIPRSLLAHPRAPLAVLARLSRRSAERARFMSRRRRLRSAGLGTAVRHPERISPEIASFLLAAGGRPASAAAAAAVARHTRDPQRLARILSPTLIIWGADDAVVPAGAAARFRESIAGSRMVILEDTGHLPMLERPSAFNALVSGFLAGG